MEPSEDFDFMMSMCVLHEEATLTLTLKKQRNTDDIIYKNIYIYERGHSKKAKSWTYLHS